MALIKCPECGKEISDKSKTCINCGYPIGETNSLLTIKAEKYPGTKLVTYQISIFNTDEKEIAKLHTGTGVSVLIDKEQDIYAKYTHSPLSEKCKSNTVHVKPNVNTKLQISYQQSFLYTKLYIYQVDVIDSE